MTKNKNVNHQVLKDVMRMTTLCTGMVKAMCAMPNNVAYIMLYNAHDHAKQHPAYKQKTKQLYKHTLELYMAYERRLCEATNFRMFEVADLAPEARKRYGNITNKDYFTLWQDFGSTGYRLALPHLQALTHKFRLSLRRRGVPYEDILCHQLTAQAVLDIAVSFHRSATILAHKEFHLSNEIIHTHYDQFSLNNVAMALEKAVQSLCSEVYALDEQEERNIQISIKDIADVFSKQENMLLASSNAIENNADIFRTKGEMKKILRICTEELG